MRGVGDITTAARVIAAALALACDATDSACPDDMPEDWTCPRALTIATDAPNCDQGAESPSAVLDASGDAPVIRVGGVVFRTGEDDVCAWASSEGPILNVLIQPCEMHPDEVGRKGFCHHHFDITLPEDSSDLERVDVFTRYDFLGYVAPEVPPVMEHGSVSLDE